MWLRVYGAAGDDLHDALRDPHLEHADVARSEQDLRHCETLVIHPD